MAQLRIGLIGCGEIAQSAHLPGLVPLAPLARLVAVCDVRAEVARRIAESRGCTWTTDYRELLADPAVDAVIIATPEFLHAEQTVAAARAGKHVLCEKPMATSMAEARAMIAAAEAAGVCLMIGHSRRFTRRYLKIRELLDQGAIGDPVLIRENERRPANMANIASPADYWQPEPGRSWRDLAKYSGGVARTGAVHEMDLFRWFAGSEARSVCAESKILGQGREVPNVMSIQVTFRNGVLAASDLYYEAPPRYPYYHQFEIFGRDGVLRARDTDLISMSRYDSKGMQFPTSFHSLLHIGDAYTAEQRMFFEAILAGTPPPLDPRDAMAALEIVLAAIYSARAGRPVDLPFEEPSHGEVPAWTS